MINETPKKSSPPHPTDVYVGNLVRKRRKELKISQGELADAVGLTFQQIQKYERGSNRISASKLYEIAGFLNKPVGYFFIGLSFEEKETDSFSSSELKIGSFLLTDEGQALAAAFANLSPSKRKGIMGLVRAVLADE